MKKRILMCVSTVAIVGIIAIIVVLNGHTTMMQQIEKNLGSSTKWKIISIEKMESDKNPIVHDTDSQALIYKDLINEIKKTKMKRERRELGMEIKKPLYTMTVSSDNDHITFTVNDEGEIHLNQTDITYVILNENSKLYDVLKQNFGLKNE